MPNSSDKKYSLSERVNERDQWKTCAEKLAGCIEIWFALHPCLCTKQEDEAIAEFEKLKNKNALIPREQITLKEKDDVIQLLKILDKGVVQIVDRLSGTELLKSVLPLEQAIINLRSHVIRNYYTQIL